VTIFIVTLYLELSRINYHIVTGLGGLEVAYLFDDYAEARGTDTIDLLLVNSLMPVTLFLCADEGTPSQ
jgi:hypothetical protein